MSLKDQIQTVVQEAFNKIDDPIKEAKRLELVKLIREIWDYDIENKQIGNIILWKIGKITDNVQTTVLPTKQAINCLREVLSKTMPNDGTIHLVWGPELDAKAI